MAGFIKRPLALYLHFPFCVRKCRYCDFLSYSADETARTTYLQRLSEEIAWRGPQYKQYEVETIFIGGGTPSLMADRQLAAMMEDIFRCFDISKNAEITMECNPGTVDRNKLQAFRAVGINRLSFGLQSMNDRELQYLGRIHTAEQFVDNYKSARQACFDNINIDLMSALPGQTTDSWLDTLRKTADLEPEHISAYSLIIEENTPFWEIYGCMEDDISNLGLQNTVLPLPDEDSERQMYHLTKAELAARDYERYEISNYARRGFECRHNLTYWYRGDYLGLGLGAASMVDNQRFSNTCDMYTYMKQWDAVNVENVDIRAQMEETMFLGLRCTKGISLRQFENHFGKDVMSVYGNVIRQYTSQGFMVCNMDADRLYLTDAGMDVCNWILADFLL